MENLFLSFLLAMNYANITGRYLSDMTNKDDKQERIVMTALTILAVILIALDVLYKLAIVKAITP